MKSVLIAVVLMLSACTAKVETPRQALAVAEISFQGVMATVQQVGRTGVIDRNEAEVLREYIQIMHIALTIARAALEAGRAETMFEQLEIVHSVLPVITAELARLQDTERLE